MGVIQEVLENPEYGSYAIFNKGTLTGFEFFESAASCLVYRQVQDKRFKQVLELNRGLGKAMNLTGQLTLDLMHTSEGDLVPIECNPRTHSAVCTLEGHKNIGAMYADPDHKPQGDATWSPRLRTASGSGPWTSCSSWPASGSPRTASSLAFRRCFRARMPFSVATIQCPSWPCTSS